MDVLITSRVLLVHVGRAVCGLAKSFLEFFVFDLLGFGCLELFSSAFNSLLGHSQNVVVVGLGFPVDTGYQIFQSFRDLLRRVSVELLI